MSNGETIAMRRKRGTHAKSLTLSLDEQVQDFLDARDGLHLYDAQYAELGDRLLPRRLGPTRSKRT